MKPEDDEPSEEEAREAAALAEALEGNAGPTPTATATGAPADALETAALLRHAHSPLAVPPALEPIVAAQAAPVLEARRARGRRRARVWIVASLAAPALAVALLLVRSTSERSAAPPAAVPPAPSARLLAAQAEATRGGRDASAALARLDLEMRAYRRQYHDGLRRRGGGTP